ncbi:MAG: hypothetical protein L0331_05855 [Chloroflexi bacterium]|nr:hypothetical protein [Chloroflexota bacterium]
MSTLFDNMTPGKAATLILSGLVMATIWLLNSVFTFTYGYSVIGPFLLVDQLGLDGSALLSGLVSFLFYDAAYTVAFLTLLFACRSVWQYGIVGIQFVVCLVLSILASVTSILLLSPLGQHVPELALEVARYLGYTGLVAGFVVNAVATIGYIATSPHMAASIKTSVRSANETAATDNINAMLDRQSHELARQALLKRVPELAAARAREMEQSYLAALGVGPTKNGMVDAAKKEREQPAPLSANGGGPG